MGVVMYEHIQLRYHFENVLSLIINATVKILKTLEKVHDFYLPSTTIFSKIVKKIIHGCRDLVLVCKLRACC